MINVQEFYFEMLPLAYCLAENKTVFCIEPDDNVETVWRYSECLPTADNMSTFPIINLSLKVCFRCA